MTAENKPTKRGKRAEGKTATAISLDEDLLKRVKEVARSDRRTLSNFVVGLLEVAVHDYEKENGNIDIDGPPADKD